MKKNKILMPIAAIGAMAAAITPLSALSSCKEKKEEEINRVVPIDAYVIDKDGVLRGFKDDFVWSENYDTMAFGYGENEPEIKKVSAAAFYNPQTNTSTIPSHIKHLKFSDTYKDGNITLLILGPLTEIGEYAFYGSPFEDVVLPFGIRTIKPFAFSHSKVEACYFPPWLNEIGEEAFSHSNLYAAAFNSVFKQFKIDYRGTFGNVPWMPDAILDVAENSCVRHVRKRAFYNCKNLVMHRIPVYCYDDTYEKDEQGYGPFAIYDESTQETVDSNIRVLDYSQIAVNIPDQYEHLPQKPIEMFNVTIDTAQDSKQTDKFIILDDHFSVKGDEQSQRDIYNKIYKTFIVPEQTVFPTRMGNWTVIRASQAKYALNTDGYLCDPIGLQRISDNEWTIPIRYFGENAPTSKTFTSFFPKDTKATVYRILNDSGYEVYLPNTNTEVYYNEAEKTYFLKIVLNDSLENLQTNSLSMELTIWSRNGFSYTYGNHYLHYASEGEMTVDSVINPLIINL